MLLALTGATGFIGQHLLRELPKRGYRLRVLLRRPASVPMWTASALIGDLARPQNMSAALEGVDAVIHSAGLPHAMSGVPEDDYRVVNTEATIGLARAARRAGAKRFVFLSSIRAQCGPTAATVLTEAVEPRPTDAYGKSKLAAERGLAELDIDWVSLRAMLVYGAGVKGNMARLMRLGSVALSAAVQQPRGAPLAASGGKSVVGNRNRAGSTGTAAASFHCRRSAGADGCGNDRGHAPWARAPAERFSAPRGAARTPASRRRPRRYLSAPVRLADR
jgi:UDP-glucose 4-epimerase